MRTVLEFREECESYVEVRALPCPDGVTRLVMLHPAHWQQLDAVIAYGKICLDWLLGFILSFSSEAHEKHGHNHEDAFREYLIYGIHRGHQEYLQDCHSLANDDWET